MTTFSLTEDKKGKSLAIFYGDGDTDCISETHLNFKNVIDLWLTGDATDENVRGLTNILQTVADKMALLSERVTVKGKKLYFDGDEFRGELADVIVGLVQEGLDADYAPLVNFLEKVMTNPSKTSVDDLYRWIKNGDLVITPTGDIVGYKGIYTREDGIGYSGRSGLALINGVEINDYVPYEKGSVVSMPRSAVDDNSGVACSTGLHIGTYAHAQYYGDQMVLVQFNPRDVVSVPKDSNGEKIRACRLVVLESITERLTTRVYETEVGDDYEAPIRDSKGRFTKASATKAQRDSKGRFIKP